MVIEVVDVEKYVLETQVRVKGKPDTWGVKERTERLTLAELQKVVKALALVEKGSKD